MIQEPHPDNLLQQQAAKKITRGGKQAIEDKAIVAYMKAYEEEGKAEAEKVFFEHFNKRKDDRSRSKTEGN